MLNNFKMTLDEFAITPTRAHKEDAGIDLYSPIQFIIRPHNSYVIDTGVHVEIPEGYVGMLKSKSGLNVKEDLVSEGVIDAGYSGSIVVKLYNHGDQLRYVAKGQKITQLVILPVETPEIILVDKIESGERGDNGFGSTGR